MIVYLPPRRRTPWRERAVLVWGFAWLVLRCALVPIALGLCVVGALLVCAGLRDFYSVLERLFQ